MNRYYFIATAALLVLFVSCKGRKNSFTKPFFDSQQEHIGDSIFVDDSIKSIVFIDSSYAIDSIVFSRYNNPKRTLKSLRTFKDGRTVFENIDYYENGTIEKYSFIDEDDSNYLYERLYHNGMLVKVNGEPFFQGYTSNINTQNLEVKKNASISYKIFYPNPPDCTVNLYLKGNNGSLYPVFKRSHFLNFLQTGTNDVKEIGTFKVDVCLVLREHSIDTTVRYNHELIYKVVD
ncbi:MAG TPA: hypothetical protein VHA52_12715 [Candidatus Babeliaceae bacterium]|nr:hypothetical protein [Candidatus Babeliaceae bacterium]